MPTWNCPTNPPGFSAHPPADLSSLKYGIACGVTRRVFPRIGALRRFSRSTSARPAELADKEVPTFDAPYTASGYASQMASMDFSLPHSNILPGAPHYCPAAVQVIRQTAVEIRAVKKPLIDVLLSRDSVYTKPSATRDFVYAAT